MRIIMISILSLIFSSCMHFGGMGARGMHGSDTHASRYEAALEKEVLIGDIRITAVFPRLELGKETVITLRLTHQRTNSPVVSSRVSFHSSFLHRAEVDNRSASHGAVDSIHHRSVEDHDIHFEQDLEDSAGRGLYSVVFVPPQAGEHRLMFHILELEGRVQDPEIIIEARRTVEGPRADHAQGMMHGDEDYLIIGGVLMGAMMILMWATGGRIF
ncbi:MAG: hypothetical protein HY563_02795 [Ignavibacteriales bacterium]|nr:hypothetical protein [Ignavibacteriales bacterium]